MSDFSCRPLSVVPTSMVFGYANGGEFRKSFHGVAPPYAQVVDSPTTIDVTPMQIDTWNRDVRPYNDAFSKPLSADVFFFCGGLKW